MIKHETLRAKLSNRQPLVRYILVVQLFGVEDPIKSNQIKSNHHHYQIQSSVKQNLDQIKRSKILV